MNIERRTFLGMLDAPAIIRVAAIMPIRKLPQMFIYGPAPLGYEKSIAFQIIRHCYGESIPNGFFITVNEYMNSYSLSSSLGSEVETGEGPDGLFEANKGRLVHGFQAEHALIGSDLDEVTPPDLTSRLENINTK